MVRFIAAIAILLGLGFGYETYTGRDIGFTSSLKWVSASALGGYGMATGTTGSVGGAMKGMAGNVGSMLGAFGN